MATLDKAKIKKKWHRICLELSILDKAKFKKKKSLSGVGNPGQRNTHAKKLLCLGLSSLDEEKLTQRCVDATLAG